MLLESEYIGLDGSNKKNCDRYKNDPDSVHELANLIIEERKYEESQQLELEKIREKSELDLEIARIRANDKDNNTEVNCTDSSSLDSLIKSIRTLTVKIPDKPEGWSSFFLSLERAFAAKSVTDKFKPEILLNLLGEKVANIIIYLKDEDLKNYDKIKSIILQEFEPTPQSCLENFKKETRQNCESHVQFASRLTTNWEYYLKLRDISNFEVLKQLIVSDKIFRTLDKETASYISVRQPDKWFDPLTLGKEIDLFYSSRVPRITDMIPSQPFNVILGNFSREKLADENFNIPGNIDLLLGAEIFYEILLPGQTNLLNTKLIFQNTVFGYIASGSIPVSSENKPHCGLIKDNVDLEKTMRRFWEIENVEPETIKNKETIICEEHFQKNHARDSTGRYIVSMPFKKDPNCLGQSKDIALKKLNYLWNRLKREPNYLKLYRDFLEEYKELDPMQEVDEKEECGMYFIPHLGVYRSDKKTSKLRVVFNASSATTNVYSLKSLQYNGGVAQNVLFSIMVRFRKHIFAFIADVQKRYQMIWINPDQRKLQRILWRENMNEPIKTFELSTQTFVNSTVTYGTTSAPFLATRTLK
ncbi:integrase catalytic domain-containing protein [Trichonephila clavipes]|nr:integrase catalytic domain-containing protein [Trichonephila clavipes]